MKNIYTHHVVGVLFGVVGAAILWLTREHGLTYASIFGSLLLGLGGMIGLDLMPWRRDRLDPADEAAVFIEYGQHDKARQVLRTAISTDPTNIRLLELLQICERNNAQKSRHT